MALLIVVYSLPPCHAQRSRTVHLLISEVVSLRVFTIMAAVLPTTATTDTTGLSYNVNIAGSSV